MVRANIQGLISSRRGTGPLKDWPFGCAGSYRGRHYIVSGFDGQDKDDSGPLRVRLVDRLCTTELREVLPDDLVKAVAPQAWQR